MRTLLRETAHEVVLEPVSGEADAAVIWLHGLGANGHDFVPVVPELGLAADARIRFVFPHAPVRAVTINGGYAMPAWYDIRDLTPEGRDDEAGFADARARIEGYLSAQHARGIASDRIVLAGFSQGGAVALHVGLRHGHRLAGILALSCYLPLRMRLAAELAPANRDTPILMCHGTQDQVVDLRFGEMSRDALRAQQINVDWRTYPMPHSVSPQQIRDISAWLATRVGKI